MAPAAPAPVDFAVCVVGHNTAHCLGAALDSILSQQGVSMRATVVDNASTDESAALAARFPQVAWISNARNVGFGAAQNQGLLGSDARYVAMVNPDLRLGPGLLEGIALRLDADPGIGLAAPRVMTGDGEPEPPSPCYPGQKHAGIDLGPLPGEIAWVLGACMVVRGDLFRRLGGFDEGFFLYSEETDLCLRVRKEGFRIASFPEWEAVHLGAQSERKASSYDLAYRKHLSLLRFYRKHYGEDGTARLVRRDVIRARGRLAWGKLRGLLGRSTRATARAAQYRALLDACAGRPPQA